MSLRSAFIPDGIDPRQALRLRRFGLALLGYLLSIGLLSIAWRFDVIDAATVGAITAAFLVINIGLYLTFRSGLNLRFADPSLTLFQMLAAITLVMYVTYSMRDGRSVALFGCFYVFLFGAFHLNTRQFAIATFYALAAHALVIVLLVVRRPEAVVNVPREWMSWLMLAGFLPCFSIVGAQINVLRRRSRDAAAELRLFTDNVPAMTVAYDQHLRCRFVNKRFAEFFGLAVEDTLGLHLRDVVGAEIYANIEDHYRQVLSGQAVTYHRVHRLPGGEERFLEIKLLPHLGDEGECLGCFSVAADITEHKLSEERIRRVAHHDSLTDLPNRILFNDRLVQSLSLAKRDAGQVALLYIDLDKFKQVNDRLGHGAGDELLKMVATRIRGQVRESDTVARVGGDEFTIILPDIAARDVAEAVAEKVRSAIAAPFPLSGAGTSVEVGASIGIAVYPGDAPDAEALIKAADAAMYRTKQLVA